MMEVASLCLAPGHKFNQPASSLVSSLDYPIVQTGRRGSIRGRQ